MYGKNKPDNNFENASRKLNSNAVPQTILELLQ